MAKPSNINIAPGGGGGRGSLGSPKSRATLAVSENKKAIAEATRKAKNAAIKKQATATLKKLGK